MNDEQNKNNNNPNSSEEVLVTEADSKKKILELARKQAKEFEEERLEWRKEKAKEDEEKMKLLIENGKIKKQLDKTTETVEALKYNAVLNKEIAGYGSQEEETPKLTKEQQVNVVLAEIIKERKIASQERRKKKEGNVFYI